jgi:menaquinone-dependent protoporphyrinogen IX oxidase
MPYDFKSFRSLRGMKPVKYGGTSVTRKKLTLLMVCFSILLTVAAYADDATLIMYYSRTGKTSIVVDELQALIPAARLVEIKSNVGILQAVFWHQLFNRNACNEPISVDLEKYNRIILCSPIWLQKISSPMRTIINTVPLKGKQMELFVVCAGHFGEGGQRKLKKQLAAKEINMASLSIIKSGGKTDEEIRKQVQEQFRNSFQKTQK